MDFLQLFLNNLLTIPIFAFVAGILLSFSGFRWAFNGKMNSILTIILLFSIGLKGGASLIAHSDYRLFFLLGILVAWGFIQPLFSFGLLRKYTNVDPNTAAAIAASFGSISVMTYIAGATFLDRQSVDYEGTVVAALAIMEVPAIISGLLISKAFNSNKGESKKSYFKNLIIDAVFNKTVLMIFSGMLVGGVCFKLQLNGVPNIILSAFTPILTLFLFNMGWLVGKHRNQFRDFSWTLSLFGLYMPLIGAIFGITISYLIGLSVGTGTLITILSASASYIAVPAAMKIALPEAKEAIYLPLSLGITFPFNVVIGIPLYYQLAIRVLN